MAPNNHSKNAGLPRAQAAVLQLAAGGDEQLLQHALHHVSRAAEAGAQEPYSNSASLANGSYLTSSDPLDLSLHSATGACMLYHLL